MDKVKTDIENHHRRVRENATRLWNKIMTEHGTARGMYLIQCKDLAEFNSRGDFLNPPFYPSAQFANMHPALAQHLDVYDPEEGFLYVITIDTLPNGYVHRNILSPQHVYKHADQE
jgi:hypothetical protein